MLLWSAEMLARPTFRNLTESFEGWAYRNGLLRQLKILERQALLERDRSQPNNRIYRLTEQGRLHVLGGRDPLAEWSRSWDQTWRWVLFDVPRAENRRRDKLRRYLRDRGFGCLQGSVWITPDPLKKEREILSDTIVDAGSLILLEGRPCGEESDAELVSAAWNFQEINAAYTDCVRILDTFPIASLHEPKGTSALQQWAKEEQAAWLRAMTLDPLLPQQLLPVDYMGQSTWRLRVGVLGQARKKLEEFTC